MKKYLLTIFCCLVFNLPVLAQNDNIEYMNIDWWRNFNDKCLVENLLTVYKNNYDLKNVALKIKANEQIVKMQFAQELPAAGFSGEISRDLRAPRQQFGNMRIPHYSQNNFYLPITAGYEIDIWGKNRLKTKSKKQQLEIIKLAQRSTYISLSSNFAADYFNLIKADTLLEIQKELVKTQKEILAMTSEEYKVGLVPITELLYQEKILNTLNAEKNNYIKTREILENNLKIYLADSSSRVNRSNFDDISLPYGIPDKINTKIIETRPDYLQEEANLKRIGFDVRIAKKEFLPSFTIFGQVGLNAYSLSTLCNSPSQFFAAGILPSMDLFSGGRKMAMLKMQKYRYEEALNNYQKTYLTAISEINSGMMDFKTSYKNYQESQEKLSTERKIYTLAREKRDIGGSNNKNVLLAKELYLSSEKELVSEKINTIIAVLGLYKATGGKNLLKLDTETAL